MRTGRASNRACASVACQRLLASADTYFDTESGSFDAFLPDSTELAAIRVPVQVVISDQSLLEFSQAAHRLAQLLGVEVTSTPGTHFPYHDHPEALVRTIRPFLRSISGR